MIYENKQHQNGVRDYLSIAEYRRFALLRHHESKILMVLGLGAGEVCSVGCGDRLPTEWLGWGLIPSNYTEYNSSGVLKGIEDNQTTWM